MAALAVPVIDLAQWRTGGAAQRAQVAQAFGRAFEDIGFATITGHGVAADLVAQTYAQAQQFFAQPMQDKVRWTPPEQIKARGYLPLGVERVAATLSGPTPPDLCEALVFASIHLERAGRGRPNYWPAQPPALAGCVNAYFDAMLTLTRELMRLSAAALDMPENSFDAAYEEPGLTLRFVCYPEQHVPPQHGQLRYGAHHDYGGLTLLRQDSPGLQVCDAQGQWHDVQPQPDSFVINVGDLMSRWTNGRWRSTLHRVVNPPAGSRGTRRLSMVAFTAPSSATQVACLPSCVSASNPARFEPVNAQAYVQGKLQASMEHAPAA